MFAKIRNFIRRVRRIIEPQSFEQWWKFIFFLGVFVPCALELGRGEFTGIWVIVMVCLNKFVKTKIKRGEK